MADSKGAKAGALEALAELKKMLGSPEPLTPVRRVLVNGLLDYAIETVQAIPELQRVRKPKDPEPTAP